MPTAARDGRQATMTLVNGLTQKYSLRASVDMLVTL